MFLSFIKDQSSTIKPYDILNNFSSIEKTLNGYLDKNDNSSLSNLMSSFMTYLTSNMPETDDSQNDNISKFLMTMPIDTAATFVRILDNLDKSGKEFMYMTKLQIKLNKNKDFRMKFYEPLIRLIR